MPSFLHVGLVAGQSQIAIGFLTFGIFVLAMAWLFQFLFASQLLELPWTAKAGNAVLAKRVAAKTETDAAAKK